MHAQSMTPNAVSTLHLDWCAINISTSKQTLSNKYASINGNRKVQTFAVGVLKIAGFSIPSPVVAVYLHLRVTHKAQQEFQKLICTWQER